jgi:hypothetical protein
VAALLLEITERNRQLQDQNQLLLEQNQQQADQIAALATRIAQLEEQKGRSSRNSSKPPSSDGAGFKPRGKDKAKGTGRNRGGQKGHPGRGRDLLPSEKCAEGHDHLPDHCGSCGTSLSGAKEGAVHRDN